MPDQPNTIPAAVTVDAAAQPQPQANDADAPAWARGLYKEIVEARKEFRAGTKQPTATTAPAQAPDVMAQLQALQAQVSHSQREMAFRDALDARGVPAAQRKLVARLFAAERPENVEEWIGATLPEFAPSAPAPAKPTGQTAPMAKPTAPASAAPVIATGSADGQRSGVLSPEMLVQARSLPRDEFWKLHEQLIASERGPQIQAVAVKPPRK